MLRALTLAVLVALIPRPAFAHPMPESGVVLRVNMATIDADLYLPVTELALGWQKTLPPDPAGVIDLHGDDLRAYVLEHVNPRAPDGRPWDVQVTGMFPVDEEYPDVKVSLRLSPPEGAPVDRLTLHYDVIFHHLITHKAIVTIASDWRSGMLEGEAVVLGTMRNIRPSIAIDRSQGSWWGGFSASFKLGAEYIAGGADHLLFLLAMLIPGPLALAAGRWGGYAGAVSATRKVVWIVSAFTLGHSATLVLGALGFVHVPSAVIESVIALSILVSAAHAFRPIIAGREAAVAAGFGLVHGLAFGGVLTSYKLDTGAFVSSMLAFNLGIEAVQLFVVMIVMPWLVLLARARSLYAPFRVAASVLMGGAALVWLAERTVGWRSPINDWLALGEHPLPRVVYVSLAASAGVAIALHACTRSRAGEPVRNPGEGCPAG